jgi:hypothetical protein
MEALIGEKNASTPTLKLESVCRCFSIVLDFVVLDNLSFILTAEADFLGG